MKFDPVAFVAGIDEAEGVAAEQVHVAKAGRDAAVAHDYGYLVQSFGQTGPELPVVLSATHAGSGIALDRVVQVGKFQRIAKEKYGCVVADQIPITFFGDRKSTRLNSSH